MWVDFAEDGGLDSMGVAIEDVQNLQGDRGIEDDFFAEVSEIDWLFGHALFLLNDYKQDD